MSKIKNKLSDQVKDLAQKNIFEEGLLDATQEMHTIYQWALLNAPIRQLRAWKKEFIRDHKLLEEQQESNDG